MPQYIAELQKYTTRKNTFKSQPGYVELGLTAARIETLPKFKKSYTVHLGYKDESRRAEQYREYDHSEGQISGYRSSILTNSSLVVDPLNITSSSQVDPKSIN